MSIFQIPDMIEEVIKNINDPKTFLSALRVNKEWYNIGKNYVDLKKKEFIKEKEFKDKNGFIHIVETFPNGIKNGKEIIYDGNDVVVERTWIKNKLEGIEKRYDENGKLYRHIPWINNIRQGNEIRYSKGLKKIIKWNKNKRIEKEKYNTNNLVGLDEYSGEKTCVRYKINNGNKIRDGVYINNQKHGVYNENGIDVLYLHGVPQLWYTKDKWEILSYLFLGLIFIVLLYKSYKQWSFKPILSNSIIVTAAISIIILPLIYAMYRGSKNIFK
jgi:antitoxin component YwqK of YwqJK toxin-antitoxin module